MLKDAKVRKALSLAIDRQEYCDNVLRNYSAPAYAYNPPSMQGAQPGEVFVEKYLKDYLPINGDPAEGSETLQGSGRGTWLRSAYTSWQVASDIFINKHLRECENGEPRSGSRFH